MKEILKNSKIDKLILLDIKSYYKATAIKTNRKMKVKRVQKSTHT